MNDADRINAMPNQAECVAEVKAFALDFAKASTAEEGIIPTLFVQKPGGELVVAAMPEFDNRAMGDFLVRQALADCPLGSVVVLLNEVFSIPESAREHFYVGPLRLVNARDLPEAERIAWGIGDYLVLRTWVHDGELPECRFMAGEMALISPARDTVGEWKTRTPRRQGGEV